VSVKVHSQSAGVPSAGEAENTSINVTVPPEFIYFYFIEIVIDTGGCCVRDIVAIHQFTYYQFTYFTRRRGAIRDRDEGTVHKYTQ
jgi:hypothetical protein